jgi:hypothetical protein
MNTKVFQFFQQNYSPGRICLVGMSDLLYQLIRMGQSGLTPDGKPSRWSHSFLMGENRSGTIHIFESDIYMSLKRFQFVNGPQESKLSKWCKDTVDSACVLGMDLTPAEQDTILSKAREICYDERYLYPVGELLGTLWAILTKTLHKKNIFDDKYAVQCATFVRMCYQGISKDPLDGAMQHLTNTSPEKIFQSNRFTFRQVMT